MSERKLLYAGCPTTCPYTTAVIVDASMGTMLGYWVSTQAKLRNALPDAVPPCPGVSMVPNGLEACALSTVMVCAPKSIEAPALLCAMAWILYVPLPSPAEPPLFGRKVVSSREPQPRR